MTQPLTRRTLLQAAGAGAAAPALLSAGPAAADQRIGAEPAHGEVARDRLRAVYERVKTPFVHGMVVHPANADERVDSASVFRHGDAWYMVHVVYRADGYDTQLRRSSNLLDWELAGDILPRRKDSFDATQAAGYIALQDTRFGGSNTLGRYDGRYWLSYIAGDDPGYEAGDLDIGVASTTDPTSSVEWERADTPVLSPRDADVRYWERAKLYKSNIIEDPARRLGARFVMYYNATTGTQYERIGMALSDDMRTWRRYRNDPVVVQGRVITGDPQVVRINDLWVMFFFVRDSYARATDTYDNFAVSTDLVNWTVWDGEALLTATRPVDRDFAHKPWLIEHEGVVYHFYTAIGAEGWGVAVATSVDLRDRTPSTTTAYASYTFVADSPAAAVDGTVEPDPSGRRWTAYRSPNDQDWLAVRLPSPRRISHIDVDIYSDGGGVQSPDSFRVEHLDGTRWLAVRGATYAPRLPTKGANRVSFAPVTAQQFRLVFTHPGNDSYAGVTEVTAG